MSEVEDPYLPPQMDVRRDGEEQKPTFYVVSKNKMTVLFLVTLGLYQLYWFWKNWSLYRQSSGEKIWPVPRAIFSIFFVPSLFSRVHDELALKREDREEVNWAPASQAGTMVILMIVRYVFDRLASRGLGSPVTDIISIILLIPMVLIFRKAQHAVNVACDDPDALSNSRYTGLNILWIVFGLILWSLGIVGSFFLE